MIIHKPSSPRIWLPGGNTILPRQRREMEAREKLARRFGIPLLGGGAADAWAFYDTFPEFLGDGSIDLDDDTFKMALFLSTSNAATTTVSAYASLTNEHANGNGYTTGGEVMTGVTWVNASGTVTFDADDVVWTASGGSIVARFAVIYDDTPTTPTADPTVCFSLLDNAPADVTATDGNTLTVAPNASGIFTLA